MGKGSLKNGTEFMIMIATMTWECRKGVRNLHVQLSADLLNTHIPEEVEQVVNHTKKVQHLGLNDQLSE